MRRLRAKGKIDEGLALAYLFAILIGLVMVYSTSSILAEARHGSHFYFLKQQLLWAVLSAIAMVCICKVDLKEYAVYSVPGLMVTIIMLALVFLMPARNGSQRWLILGPATIQPSELFKFLTVYYLAFSLSNRKRNISRLKELLLPYGPLLGVGLVLILLEPDLGTTAVILLTVLGIFYLAGARMLHIFGGLIPLAATGSFVVFVLGYKKARVLDWISSLADPLQGSYQSTQAALTLGSGGILGTGLGEGVQKLFFLPYPHTDFIFAATGEEIGLAGLLVVLSLLFYIIWRGLRIAGAQPDRFGYLLGAGMALSLFVNVAINLAVVTSLIPVTGLALPFISYGGSSLLVSSAAVGVLLNLSRRVQA